MRNETRERLCISLPRQTLESIDVLAAGLHSNRSDVIEIFTAFYFTSVGLNLHDKLSKVRKKSLDGGAAHVRVSGSPTVKGQEVRAEVLT